MQIVPKSVSVKEGEGFGQDLLGRKEFGDRLTNLVTTAEGPFTMILDGAWGSGKTTFVRMWADVLKKQEVPVIYFNAFDSDYLSDSFTALAGEFLALETKSKPTRKKFVNAAVGFGKSLAVHSTRIGVKALTVGAIDILDIKDAAGEVAAEAMKELGKDASDGAAELIKKRLMSRKDEKAAMDRFRVELSSYVEALCNDKNGDDQSKSLVFIIDELDRCRPDFALSLVEAAKHLFDVPRVIFLLVANLEQLSSAVNATYGSTINSRAYLEKFYNLVLHLPEPEPGDGPSKLAEFIERAFAGLPSDVTDMPAQKGPVHRTIVSHLRLLQQKKGLSLRKLERLATQIAVVYASTNNNKFRWGPVIADLCLMKLDYPDVYRAARTGQLTLEALEGVLPYKKWFAGVKEGESGRDIRTAGNFWRTLLGKDMLGDDAVAMYKQEFPRFDIYEPQKIIPLYCAWIDGFSFPMPPEVEEGATA